jgi:hypothetical protein
LNVIERRRWVRPYLRYYLRLGEDDQRSVLENRPLSRHLAMREEKLLKIDMVRFERLATLLRQGVDGKFEYVAFVEVGSIVIRVSTLLA